MLSGDEDEEGTRDVREKDGSDTDAVEESEIFDDVGGSEETFGAELEAS